MKFLKSKTIKFSAIIVVLGVLEMNLPMVKENLGDHYGWVFISIAVATAVLRSVTTKPLSDK